MDNVITFQMRSAEQEEDLGELWERMQANLTAVSSSQARDRRAPTAPLRPRPAPAPLGLGAGAAPCCREGKQHMAWPLRRPRQRRATGRSRSLHLSPRGQPCHLSGRLEQGSPYGCPGRELAPFRMELPRPLAPRPSQPPGTQPGAWSKPSAVPMAISSRTKPGSALLGWGSGSQGSCGVGKPGELRCGAEPSRVRKPRTCRSRCWPRTRCAPNSVVPVSGHPAPARCMEEARGAGLLGGETEARGKLRHGEVAVAEPAGVRPSGALRAGPCCLPFPGELSFPLFLSKLSLFALK